MSGRWDEGRVDEAVMGTMIWTTSKGRYRTRPSMPSFPCLRPLPLPCLALVNGAVSVPAGGWLCVWLGGWIGVGLKTGLRSFDFSRAEAAMRLAYPPGSRAIAASGPAEIAESSLVGKRP